LIASGSVTTVGQTDYGRPSTSTSPMTHQSALHHCFDKADVPTIIRSMAHGEYNFGANEALQQQHELGNNDAMINAVMRLLQAAFTVVWGLAGADSWCRSGHCDRRQRAKTGKCSHPALFS
jgi:hypothetical protein